MLYLIQLISPIVIKENKFIKRMVLMKKHRKIVIRSSKIYTKKGFSPESGYIFIEGNIIKSITKGNPISDEDVTFIDCKNGLVTAGNVDSHCFFSGHAMNFIGEDFSDVQTSNDLFTKLSHLTNLEDNKAIILGHDLPQKFTNSKYAKKLNKLFPDIPTVIMVSGAETCLLNSAAESRFNFTSQTCYPEAYWRLLHYVFSDKKFIKPLFVSYMKFLNSRGITAIKEMGFDDFYGFTDILKELEESSDLSLRVNFMSQPVSEKMNIDYAKKMSALFTGDAIRFSGFNKMTDGSISEMKGDLKQPYTNNSEITNIEKIDWNEIERDLKIADNHGFRFSLHAQGDVAVSKTVSLMEKCQTDINGKLLNRHAITDLELTEKDDLKKMGDLGIIAEIYPQITSLYDNPLAKVKQIKEYVGPRAKYYWNRKEMINNNIILSCGTDLPLLYDDIPESIFNACGGYFTDDSFQFNSNNCLNVSELIDAWTSGGAYNLGLEDKIGTLEAGKLADIVIYSDDLFSIPIKNVKQAKVVTTIYDGKIVFKDDSVIINSNTK